MHHDADQDEPTQGAAFTCRFTAALRHVEGTLVPEPVLVDPLAGHLCGPKALALAQAELAGLIQQQGPGKHLRVPARTRLLDELLSAALARISQHGAADRTQICSLGAGMDTRPWRLKNCLGPHIAWYDVDQPEIAHLKRTCLQAAGASMSAAETNCKFPLLCGSYQLLGADLAQTSLRSTLLPAGFDPCVPTVFILEALIYYMPLNAAGVLLQAMAELSAPGTQLVLTCADSELLEASRSKMHSSHVFANLWHFDDQQLCACEQYRQFWHTLEAPVSTRELASRMLQADTYVALYGGTESVIVAAVKDM